MKRFDRATYVLFLLILMADVARVHASVPVGGEGGGGLVLSAASAAAGQLQAHPSRAALLVFRQAVGAQRVAALRRYGRGFSAWSFQGRAGALSYPVSLSGLSSGAAIFAPGPGSGFLPDSIFRPVFSSLGIFEHSGSPAP